LIGGRRISIADQAAVDQQPLAPVDGRQHAGNRRRGEDGVERGSLGEVDLLSGQDAVSTVCGREAI
jgi:hypothetical protein